MGLRDRLLMPMDRYQRIVLAFVFGASLTIQILTTFYYLQSYNIRLLHFVMFLGMIAVFLNPKGVRILLFAFFAYMLIYVLGRGSFSYATLIYALSSCFYGLPLMWLGVSINLIIYIHIGLYAVLAYFSFNNPFKPKVKLDSDVIDDFE